RQKDVLAQKGREALVRGARHDEREERVAAVAVAVVAAGREVGAVLGGEQLQHVRIVNLPRRPGRNQILVVDEPRDVREQWPDADGGRRLRQLGKPLADRVIERQPPVLREQQDRRGGELLGHRGEPVVGGGRRRDLVLEVRVPVGAAEDDRPVAQDEHRSAGYVTVV